MFDGRLHIAKFMLQQSLVKYHLPSLHCTVIGFAVDWESHKSLKHDHESLTELLGRAFFQPYPIQGIQLVEVVLSSSWLLNMKRLVTLKYII